MKKMALNGRLLLRKIFTFLSLGIVSFVFQACYGMPMVSLNGTVKASDTEEPIPGIQVSIVGEDTGLTDENGEYFLYAGETYKRVTVLFEDIDGPENGEFQDKEVVWDTGNGPLDVVLDPKE